MRANSVNAQKIKADVVSIIGRYLDLNQYKVFLFGSRVTQKGSERSDFDIGVEGPEPISAKIMAQIRDDANNLPTLYKLEIVDFKTISPDFRKVALKHTQTLSQ